MLEAAQKDPDVKKALIEVAVETEKEVIGPLFLWKHNGIPAGNGWNRSANNAEWGFDYLMRTGTARSNMYDNRPTETQYFYTDGDSIGIQLEGKNLYTVTFPKGQLPPVNGFWSLTLYNKYHLFEVNDLNRYSLGTKTRISSSMLTAHSPSMQAQNLLARTRSRIGFQHLKGHFRYISAAIGEKRQFSTARGFRQKLYV